MTDLIKNSSEAIICPRGSGQGEPLVFDLRAILKAEHRQMEVQFVTREKAGELLSAFTISWRDLHENSVRLEKELNDSDRALNKRRAILILDEVPEALKVRGLANNEAHREAVVALDENYATILDRKERIEYLISWFSGKMKSFQMSFDSVKKILGESAFNYLGGRNDLQNGDSGTSDIGVGKEEQFISGFGKPKY